MTIHKVVDTNGVTHDFEVPYDPWQNKFEPGDVVRLVWKHSDNAMCEKWTVYAELDELDSPKGASAFWLDKSDVCTVLEVKEDRRFSRPIVKVHVPEKGEGWTFSGVFQYGHDWIAADQG